MSGIGIDIVEIERISKSINDTFLSHILSKQELEISKDYKDRKLIEYVAGRFCVKEAIIKCLSDYEIPRMNELTILNNDNGKPYIKYKDYNIDISISHEIHYAVAIALLK